MIPAAQNLFPRIFTGAGKIPTLTYLSTVLTLRSSRLATLRAVSSDVTGEGCGGLSLEGSGGVAVSESSGAMATTPRRVNTVVQWITLEGAAVMITNTACRICRLEFFALFGLYRLQIRFQICLKALIDAIGLRVNAQN